jgi:sugar phosphate isomerase/epimerase
MMKLGLMSVTYAGFFYSGRALSVEEMIPKAARLGFDGLELLGRAPHASPLEMDQAARLTVRRLAEAEGVEIAAIGGQTDFSFPDDRIREWCLLHLIETIRLARDLGSPIVRVFAAGFDNMRTDASYRQQWNWAKQALQHASSVAEKAGVVLALQNHAPILHSYKHVHEMIQEVGSPALKACIDPHCLWWADEPMDAAVRECGPLLAHSHLEDFRTLASNLEFFNPKGWVKYADWEFCPLGQGHVDHRSFVNALKEIDYSGYLVYPICGPVHRGHDLELAPLSHIDELVEQALLYMRGLVSAKPQTTLREVS